MHVRVGVRLCVREYTDALSREKIVATLFIVKSSFVLIFVLYECLVIESYLMFRRMFVDNTFLTIKFILDIF